MNDIMSAHLAKFENILNGSSSGFLAGDSPTIADIAFFRIIRYLNKNILDHLDCKALLKAAPKVTAHWQKMLNLDSISTWYSEEQKGDGTELEGKGLELVYFKGEGRAEAIRLACRHGNVAFRDVRINGDILRKMKEDGVLPFGQVPVLFVDGDPIAQSSSILRYVGKRGNLYSSDNVGEARIDALLAQMADMQMPIGVSIHPESNGLKYDPTYNNTQSAVMGRLGPLVAKHLFRFEAILKNSTSGYLVGDSPTIVDFAFFAMLQFFQEKMGPLLHKFASVITYCQKMKKLESIDRYYQEEHKGDGSLEKKGLELVYFDIAGRAEAIRLARRHGNVAFRDIRLDRDRVTYNKMKDDGVLPFGQLPVMFVDGIPFAQSTSILRYVGKLSTCSPQLYPSDDIGAAKIDSLLAQVADMSTAPTVSSYPHRYGWKFDDPPTSGENTKKNVRTRMYDIISGHLAKFETILSESSSGFLAGDSPTIADIALFIVIRWLNKNIIDHLDCKALLEAAPKVTAHSQKMLSLDSISTWYNKEQKGDGSEVEGKGLELVYFNMEGRAEAIRLACKHGNVAIRDVRINKDIFQKMKKDGVLPFDQLPVLFVDGEPLAQSTSILRYVGKRGNLYRSDNVGEAKVDALLAQVEDMQTPLIVSMHPEGNGWKYDK